jgi:hypothetical protein
VLRGSDNLPELQRNLAPILNDIQTNFQSVANAVNTNIGQAGATSTRPTLHQPGESFFDTTLNKPIWWNGSHWVDATGTIV